MNPGSNRYHCWHSLPGRRPRASAFPKRMNTGVSPKGTQYKYIISLPMIRAIWRGSQIRPPKPPPCRLDIICHLPQESKSFRGTSRRASIPYFYIKATFSVWPRASCRHYRLYFEVLHHLICGQYHSICCKIA